MNDIELAYFRDLAFKYLPKSEQERIKRNIAVGKRVGWLVNEAYRHMLNPYKMETATETAACYLLNAIALRSQLDTNNEEPPYSDEDFALVEGEIIRLVFELAKVAEIHLPAWILQKQKPNTQSPEQEIKEPISEVQSLEIENTEPKQTRSNPVRDVMLDIVKCQPDIKTAEMWARIKEMADSQIWPFVHGGAEGEIKYEDGEKIGLLKKRNVGERLKRIKDTR